MGQDEKKTRPAVLISLSREEEASFAPADETRIRETLAAGQRERDAAEARTHQGLINPKLRFRR